MLEEFAGFGLQGYRSFGGAEIARFGVMNKVHAVAGKNNVGKSNALEFARGISTRIHANKGYVFPDEGMDVPSGQDETRERRLSIAFRLTDSVRESLRLDRSTRTLLALFQTEAYTRGEPDTVWFDLMFTPGVPSDQLDNLTPSPEQFHQGVVEGGLERFSFGQEAGIVAYVQSADPLMNFGNIIRAIRPWQFFPQTVWVNAVRSIREVQSGESVGSVTGAGLIEQLAQLQHPDMKVYAVDRARFDKLQAFVADVLEDEAAQIEIPNRRDTILVRTRSGVRPIERLGTGISEVIMLASVATGESGKLICMEEPELHLHPTLQRKLADYLHTETDNRYLISTHSASLINSEQTSVSHVTMDDSWSRVDRVITPRQRASAAFDLGNRASDIVQSNFVVWVEGPSDRIYVASWIRALDPTLIEGAHFTVMFYGGGLLNSLSVEDGETDELIDLLKINRNMAIVIDSDMGSASGQLNFTKLRILAELEESGSLGWVTEGYTIENYVPSDLLRSATDALYAARAYKPQTSQWRSPLGAPFKGATTKPSKVMVARKVVADGIDLSIWSAHLRDRVQALVSAIRAANDLPAM